MVTQVRKELRSRLNSLPGGLYNSSNWPKFHPLTLPSCYWNISTCLTDIWSVTMPRSSWFWFWKCLCPPVWWPVVLILSPTDYLSTWLLLTEFFCVCVCVSLSHRAVCFHLIKIYNHQTQTSCFGHCPSSFYSLKVVWVMLVEYFCIYSDLRWCTRLRSYISLEW